MRQDFGQKAPQRRPCFKQPEQVHPARQPLDDIAQSIERMVRIGPGSDCPDKVRKHGLESLLRGRRTQRAGFPGAPVGDTPGSGGGGGEANSLKLSLQDVRIVRQLRALAGRLSQQWSVDCSISSEGEQASIPIRLHLDLQQLLREAVANAVRHGHADRIDVGLAVADDRLQLSVADNGRGFANGNGKPLAEPWSLKERVERANGTIRLVSAPGSTNVFISLPLAGAAA
jgi:signal transduction histidine kinase